MRALFGRCRRVLAADMVQQANSGHPGAAMGCAPIAHLLWQKVMAYNPADPKWPNRDRFVLSNGHACALQYAMLHLSGYDLSLEDLKKFRQIGSRTPGHPEVRAPSRHPPPLAPAAAPASRLAAPPGPSLRQVPLAAHHPCSTPPHGRSVRPVPSRARHPPRPRRPPPPLRPPSAALSLRSALPPPPSPSAPLCPPSLTWSLTWPSMCVRVWLPPPRVAAAATDSGRGGGHWTARSGLE